MSRGVAKIWKKIRYYKEYTPLSNLISPSIYGRFSFQRGSRKSIGYGQSVSREIIELNIIIDFCEYPTQARKRVSRKKNAYLEFSRDYHYKNMQ